MEIPQKVSDFCRDFPKFFNWGDDNSHLYPETISAFFCSLTQDRARGGCPGHLSSPGTAQIQVTCPGLHQGRGGCDPNIACDAPNHRFHQSNHGIRRRGVSVLPVLLTHEQLMECESSTDSTRAAKSHCDCSCDRVCRETAAEMLCDVQATVSLQRSCATFVFCLTCSCFSMLVPLLKLVETVSLQS